MKKDWFREFSFFRRMRGLLLVWVLDLTSSRIYRGQSYAKYGQYDIYIQSEKGKVEKNSTIITSIMFNWMIKFLRISLSDLSKCARFNTTKRFTENWKKFLNKILFKFTSLKKSFSFHFLRFFPDVEEFRSQNSGQSRHELSGVN